jgi:predicted Zn finger-like uncharacterized protein
MAMLVINCPECDKEIKVPEDAEGKKIRCKECDHVFVVEPPRKAAPARPAKAARAVPAKPAPAKPATPAKPVAAKPATPAKPAAKPAKPAAKPDATPASPPADDDDDPNPYGVTEMDFAHRCPECANEMESPESVVCLHCGYNTVTRQRYETKATYETTGGEYFLWHLPPSLCVLTILGLIGLDIWYCNEIEGLVKDEWYDFLASGGIKLWFVVLSIFGMWVAGKFAFKRWYYHPHPPERKKKI